MIKNRDEDTLHLKETIPTLKGMSYMKNCTLDLLGIKDSHLEFDPKYKNKVIAAGFYQHKKVRKIHLRQSYPCACPVCGQKMRYNGFKTVEMLGLPSGGITNVFSIRKQKYLCPASAACPKTITKLAEIKDVKANDQISQAVKYQAISKLDQNISQKDIAADFGISGMTVMRFAQELSTYLRPNHHFLPQNIAFDDFKAGNFSSSGMSIIVMDIATRRTLDIVRSRHNTYLRSYFLQYDRQARWAVQTVTVDLYSPYRSLIHEIFPQALIIADRFHVVTQAYRALNLVRTQTMKQAGQGSHNARALKHYWKSLTKDSTKLDFKTYRKSRNFRNMQLCEQDIVERLLNMSSALRQAYVYYQTLLQAVHQRDPRLLESLTRSAAGMPEPIKLIVPCVNIYKKSRTAFRRPFLMDPWKEQTTRSKPLKRLLTVSGALKTSVYVFSSN
ncbi:transposase [Ligilactobacillus acidipiscis]|nr:transposase [Ligilactobacillus acidipiscis]